MKTRPSISVRVRRYVVISLILLIPLAVIAFHVWITSARGSRQIEQWVARWSGERLRIEGATFAFPNRISVQRMEWRDDQGLWLELNGIEALVPPAALMDRELRVRRLTIARVHLNRLPTSNRPAQVPRPIRPPRPFTRIFAEQCEVRQLQLEPAIAGRHITGSGSVSLDWVAGQPMHLNASLDIQPDALPPFSAQARMSWDGIQFELAEARMTNAVDQFVVRGWQNATNDDAAARVEINVANIDAYHAMSRVEGSGPLAGSVDVHGNTSAKTWIIATSLHSDELSFRTTTAAGLAVEARVDIGSTGLLYKARIAAAQVKLGEWHLRNITTTNHGDRTSHAMSWSVEGNYRERQTFNADGDVSYHREAGIDHLFISQLRGTWDGTPVALAQPADIIFSGTTLRVSAPSIRSDEAEISAQAVLISNRITRLNADARHLPMAHIARLTATNPAIIAGTADINVDLTREKDGTLGGRITGSARDITSDAAWLAHFQKSSLAITGDIRQRALTIHVSAAHPLIERLEVATSVPLKALPDAREWSVDQEGSIDASLRFRARLRDLGRTLVTGPAAISGLLEADLQARDLAVRPTFEGAVTLRNGRYRNLQTGTYLDQVDITMAGDTGRLVIAQATASDGGQGRVEAEGHIDIGPMFRPSWDLTAHLTNASLFRLIRSELPLSGDLRITGDTAGNRLSGQLWLEPFRFVIPRRLPAGLADMNIVEINGPDGAPPPASTTMVARSLTPSTSAPVDLNIQVETRAPFEVNGRGLNSRWRGNIRLHGNSNAPKLSGSIQAVDGYVMLLGRRFNVDDGRIVLNGAVPPNPGINASASTRIGDTIARLLVSGTVTQPDILLVSDPVMPREEIMALILFGKATDAMSAWQALALANGLRVLSGAGDLADVIDRGQSLIKVDQVDIRQDEEGEGLSSIAVGKYFGRRFYVEGEKGFGNAADTVTVTLELTPRLTLETEASPRIREGIGLFWRRDF